ncbi:alanine--tRNA ligase, mitochondrial-like [Penaeus japonicus]|uniref:alanine--tRNA ligase, mitochondrial-like n=1 Tax=Penaeus japonicus TaxID=27405 RepID=UPI001C713488|nr:alanine--tRNA ligase, mitochondrial-like [Penaeus japonicus]
MLQVAKHLNLPKAASSLVWHGTCRIRRIHWPSRSVRSTFTEFFKGNGHQHIRSSPVIPWNDPSLAFVNAGMNQFKPIFLGHQQPPCPRATNSQKCIRVGGKHNDLADVGADTYHHTFFEMLGNWSFGDYFKKEACAMAWSLLTEVYRLPTDRLYVTYFGGNAEAGLEADVEARDIWRSIGVADSRIIPFGMKDNFWEMGSHGPCGPCTEIHYDRLGRAEAGERVNLGVEDLIELWNLVFIQYERLKDGNLKTLSTQHVDTGMGLERITAVLNGKSSNYDTDLFMPIFTAVEKMSGRREYKGYFEKEGQCIDTAYRILADHTRMFTVALADGMFPEDSHKLRRVMRRAITIGEEQFGFKREDESLCRLTRVVAETLSDAYPELSDQLERIRLILRHEEELFSELQKKVNRDWTDLLQEQPELRILSDLHAPGVIEGVKEILPRIQEWKEHDCKLPGHVALKLYDTYGLHIDQIEELAEVYDLTVDQEGFERGLSEVRQLTKSVSQQRMEGSATFNKEVILDDLVRLNVPVTDDSAKYFYESMDGLYSFKPLKSRVLSLLVDGKLSDTSSTQQKIGIITDRTNFYHEAGGQVGDTGSIVKNNTKVKITSADNVGGYVVHWGEVEYGELAVGDIVTSSVQSRHRIGCMQHHTATHLLNSAVKFVTGLSCQRSSLVTPDHLSLSVRTYEPLNESSIERTENIVKKWIAANKPISRRNMDIKDLLREPNITLVPGEVYPDTVHVITSRLDLQEEGSEEKQLLSVEPCCGTHLHNSGHIGNFVITSIKSAGVGIRNIRAVCGAAAGNAVRCATETLTQLKDWEKQVEVELSAGNHKRIRKLEKDLISWHTKKEEVPLPYLVRTQINTSLDNMTRSLRNSLRGDVNKQMIEEMNELTEAQPDGPIIHVFTTDFGTSKAVLSKATKIANKRPVLVMAKAEGVVVGRAVMPEEKVANGASAAAWLECARSILGGKASAPKGQDPLLVCNMRSVKIKDHEIGEKLEEALMCSKDYIEKYK